MMSATPPVQVPDLSAMHALAATSIAAAKEEELGNTVVADVDDRSSSLSDIGEIGATGHDDIATLVNGSDGGDTEAETERLDDSPQKERSQQNVVLTTPIAPKEDDSIQASGGGLVVIGHEQGDTTVVETAPQTSDISSLEDSSDDARMSPMSNARKRKRPLDSPSPQPMLHVIPAKSEYPANGRILEVQERSRSRNSRIGPEEVPVEQHRSSSLDIGDLSETAAPETSPHKRLKSKRKGKKSNSAAMDIPPTLATEITAIMETKPSIETRTDSHEDFGMDDPVGGAEIETSAKTEEGLVKRKTALDALSAIEQCFASLKEKLYDERIARCDAELAMLESPTPTHPELLAALEVIDHERDRKIQHEATLVKYKLETLQRVSIAEKAQAHAQYMLRVQDIRETHLTNLNDHFYRIQHERRAVDNGSEYYMYHFQTKRSDQIRRQAAYNKEVSLLSGIAKHVGFPAAPEIKGLKPAEVEGDLREMGITLPVPVAPVQAAIPRPSLPLSASFSRQKSTTDEGFLQQNPWANPQHPAHARLQRQRSAMSRPDSPVVTPAPQRRAGDLNAPQGSASTIADPLSGQNSSIIPTPATGEETQRTDAIRFRNGDRNIVSTPTKGTEPDTIVLDDQDQPEEPHSTDHKPKPSSLKQFTPSLSLHRNSSPKNLHGTSISNPLSVPDGPTPLPFSKSPISRFPTVKVEERPSHSLLGAGHHALSVSTGANGLGGRFGAVV